MIGETGLGVATAATGPVAAATVLAAGVWGTTMPDLPGIRAKGTGAKGWTDGCFGFGKGRGPNGCENDDESDICATNSCPQWGQNMWPKLWENIVAR